MDRRDDHLRHGIALFNAGHYYDAHEALEDAWRATCGPSKLFVQGLTQAAVALHHHSTGNLAGAQSVLARAIRNLSPFVPLCEGLKVAELLTQLEDSLAAMQARRDFPQPQMRP